MTANASVTVESPGPLQRVVITPSTANLLAGGTQQFSAQGYDDNNVPIPNLIYTWVVVAGGGTISSTGLFTAGSVGGSFKNTVLVAASQGNTVKVDYASVSYHSYSRSLGPCSNNTWSGYSKGGWYQAVLCPGI